MLTEENIKRLAAQILEGTLFYVTGVNVGAGHQVSVRIDGDQGVTVKDCADLSREISAALEREHDDFSLEVSSHGATSPLVMPRQYRRHIGRTLEIRLTDGTRAEGTLGEVADDHIGIHATFAFDRRDYGMAWTDNPEAKVVGNKVTVDISLLASKVAPAKKK